MQEKKVFVGRPRQQKLFAVGPAYKKVGICENFPTPSKNNGPSLIWPIPISHFVEKPDPLAGNL